MNAIEVGDTVRYSKQKWQVSDVMGGLAIIENAYDTKVVPTTSLKKVVKK